VPESTPDTAASQPEIPSRFLPDPETVEEQRASLTAAADGHPVRFSRDAAAAVYETWRLTQAAPPGQPPPEGRFTALTLRVDHVDVFDQDAAVNRRTWRRVAEVTELEAANPTGALTADGGPCAPGTAIYEFFNPGPDGGLLTLPVVGAPRASVTMPVSPSVADVLAEATWDAAVGDEFTQEMDEASAVKPCYFVPCPDTVTWKVSAFPVCLTFGNFSARAWPEMVEEYLAVSLRTMRHKVNATLIAALIDQANPVGPYPPDGGISGAISGLQALLGFYAALYRDRHRLAPGAPLDVVMPHWVPDAYAADKLRRASTFSYEGSIGEFTAALTSRGLRPQFVHDWQTLSVTPEVGFPDTADVLLFAPGSAVRLDGGTLDIGVVRDSTLNQSNNFQIFTEPFAGIAVPGYEVMEVLALPTCPTGETGAPGGFSCRGS
jgi:hypothetical protein